MSRRLQSGLSLIELMVSVVIGLILLAGISQIFLNSKQGYRVQESAARLQENSRYAIETLSRAVRMADFWAGVDPAAITRVNGNSLATSPIAYASTYGTSCTAAGFLINPSDAVHGYSGVATGLPTGFDCIQSADYVASSDVLVLRFADADQWFKSADVCTASQDEGRVFLKSLTGKRAVLFDASTSDCAAASTTGTAAIAGEARNGVLNYRYRFAAFSLRRCSTTPCSTTADGGMPIPSLIMTDLTGDATNGTNAKVIAEGIEMLKFEYGVDTTGDFIVDRYYKAGGVTNWSSVLTVRVSMIVRGDTLDSFTDTTTYTMTDTYGSSTAADYAFTASNTSPVFAARHQRRLLVKELQVRNRFRK